MTTTTDRHHWRTVSSHVTSEGWVRYQKCPCGVSRMLLNAERIDALPAREAIVGQGKSAPKH